MNIRTTPRTALAAVSVALVVPAAVFFLSAVGRSLQPTAHEPARTLDAIVAWFGALPGLGVVALLLVLPLLGFIAAVALLVTTWRRDASARADVVALTQAAVNVARRRPALLVTFLVVAFGLLYFAAITVHAIAG